MQMARTRQFQWTPWYEFSSTETFNFLFNPSTLEYIYLLNYILIIWIIYNIYFITYLVFFLLSHISLSLSLSNICIQDRKMYNTYYNVWIYVTLSVKTQLKSFFCDLLFSTKKNHPSYGTEHSVKILLLYL